MEGMKFTVLVVDDEPLARDELRFMLGQCENIEVVGKEHVEKAKGTVTGMKTVAESYWDTAAAARTTATRCTRR